MTETERSVLNRQIGVLEGLAWGACLDEKFHCFAEALDDVVSELTKLMAGGTEDGKEESREKNVL